MPYQKKKKRYSNVNDFLSSPTLAIVLLIPGFLLAFCRARAERFLIRNFLRLLNTTTTRRIAAECEREKKHSHANENVRFKRSLKTLTFGLWAQKTSFPKCWRTNKIMWDNKSLTFPSLPSAPTKLPGKSCCCSSRHPTLSQRKTVIYFERKMWIKKIVDGIWSSAASPLTIPAKGAITITTNKREIVNKKAECQRRRERGQNPMSTTLMMLSARRNRLILIP